MKSDTSPFIDALRCKLLREAGFQKRLDLARSLIRTTRAMAWRGIRKANPTLSEDELKILFVEIHYGKELADRVRKYLSKADQPGSSIRISGMSERASMSKENRSH